ncbi:MAG: hypothetical protein HUK24_03880, partial [Sphaerochaetaceae bacterium]|nr:hypothetical protein [Sphaerochaetaceae bacterium]
NIGIGKNIQFKRAIVPKEDSTINKENLVKISTKNTYEDIEKGVFEIAKVAGTEAIAKENLKTYKAFFEETKKEMEERDFTNKTVFVNVNQEPFARALGLNVVGTFGPSPVTAAEIALCSEQGFDLIIDNVHNIVSEPLKDVSPSSKFVIWRNFPETEGSPEALLEVMKNNVKALIN